MSVDAPPERYRRLVERIANWTEQELAHVDARQVRHIARIVIAGADPVYPPFAEQWIVDYDRGTVERAA